MNPIENNWIVQNLQNALDTWNTALAEILAIITQSPQEFRGGGIWSVITTINGGLQAIGLALLVLFFAMSIFKTASNVSELKRPESAVKMFQLDEEIEVDGKYGDKTHAALMAAMADHDDGKPDGQGMEDKPSTGVQPSTETHRVTIVSESGTVNIRVGNSSNHARITSVAPGTTFEYIATAPNGWNAVVIGAQVGWVSGQYSKVL